MKIGLGIGIPPPFTNVVAGHGVRYIEPLPVQVDMAPSYLLRLGASGIVSCAQRPIVMAAAKPGSAAGATFAPTSYTAVLAKPDVAPRSAFASRVTLPSEIAAAKLLDWWRTDFGVTQASGAVSQWDGIGGDSWTQSTAGRKPNVITDGWAAGIDTIDFDTSSAGNEDVMVNTETTSTTKVYTWAVVFNNHTTATNNVDIIDSNQALIMAGESSAGTRALGFYDGTHYSFGTDTAITGKQAVMFTFSDDITPGIVGNVTVYRGGSQVGSPIAGVCKNISGTLGLFGNKNQNGQWLDGEIADLAMWEKVLSPGERQLYFEYTMARYGV